MLRREESETALPQKERFRWVSWGQPRARTSVAVSERAQQNDCGKGQFVFGDAREKTVGLTKSRSRSPLAALVR